MLTNKEMRRDYLSDNPEDEVEPYLSGETWEKVRGAWGYIHAPFGSEVVHHIWRGGTGYKADLWSLLITVSPASHDYVHKCPKHGVVACIYAKIKKGEFDSEEVKKALGRDLIAQTIIWREQEEVTHPYYTDLINKIEELHGIVHDNDDAPS